MIDDHNDRKPWGKVPKELYGVPLWADELRALKRAIAGRNLSNIDCGPRLVERLIATIEAARRPND